MVVTVIGNNCGMALSAGQQNVLIGDNVMAMEQQVLIILIH